MENFLQNIKKYNYKDKDNNKSNKHQKEEEQQL